MVYVELGSNSTGKKAFFYLFSVQFRQLFSVQFRQLFSVQFRQKFQLRVESLKRNENKNTLSCLNVD